ncbi:haloacid dehalogenase type II [Polaribacter sp.]|nr:haloacid dehalogenase type II [Polaribacter sp.]
MIKAVFFDMNETLLNLNPLKKEFKQYFDDPYVVNYWFAKLLHTSTVIGIMDEYVDFGKLADAGLENIFYENEKELPLETKQSILQKFKKLPAYDDVIPAISYLKEQNIRVIALSNSSNEMIKEQLENANILSLFDDYYSVDSTKKFKPFHDIYKYVATKEKLATNEIVMTATHDWDLFGAKKAGLVTAYIQRKKSIYNPYYLQPDYSSLNLLELMQEIV